MRWRVKLRSPICIGLGCWFMAQTVAAQTLSRLQFQCPARVQVQDALVDESIDGRGFASRFSNLSPAALLRITLQEGSGKDAVDIKPQVSRERRTWELPAERKEAVSIWCHYEGGVGLVRLVPPSLTQCDAAPAGSEAERAAQAYRGQHGLGRQEVVCR